MHLCIFFVYFFLFIYLFIFYHIKYEFEFNPNTLFKECIHLKHVH